MSSVREPEAVAPPEPQLPDDVEPCENETRDRIITGTVTVVPILCLLIVAWQLWNSLLGWSDIAVFAIMYLFTGFGVTVGFHRLFTHRSFKAVKPVRALLAIGGCMAVEGPIISWVADHRKHHVFSDRPGDPHSPHVDHGHGLRGALKGLLHAHVGWIFLHTQRGLKSRYAPDLLKEPMIKRINDLFVLWVVLGLVIPFFLGWAIGGSVHTALTGLLWGGAIRMLVLHHATFSINSLCHFFGKQDFATPDESRNLFWLAPITFGEAWHNNHHAFPTSAAHGMRRWEFDPSALVIRGLEKVGLVTDVVRISEEKQATKRAASAAG